MIQLLGPAAFVALAVEELSYVRSTLGYAVAEQVLDLCAQRLVSETRGEDLVIGLGGDSFAVILQGAYDAECVRKVADRLADRLKSSYLVDGHLVDVEVHAGIAMNSGEAGGFDTLLSQSSLALRAVKSGRFPSPCFFEQAMEEELVLEQALRRDLRRALPLRQFALHYQPQVNTEEGGVTGVEALLRWNHPVRGPVSPAVFIPLAESTGAIHALGGWVLRTACKQAATLPTEVTMAVNVSPLQLRSPAFVQDVKDALNGANLPPSRLEVEITEGILLDTSETTYSVMNTLIDMGVRFAIDDFGTGYSSLGQIGRLPFQTIKIDRSLVGHDPRRRAVVRSVVALASGLDMSVLAEGVETSQDLRALQLDGCSLFQGFFFSRPVVATQLHAIVEQIRTSQATAATAVPSGPRDLVHRRCPRRHTCA